MSQYEDPHKIINDNIVDLSHDVNGMKNEMRAISGILETEFQRVHSNIRDLKSDVTSMQDDIDNLQDDITSFKNRFEEFVKDLEKKNNVTHAQGQIIILNQEIEKQFGLYEKVRKYLLGILQSVDTGLVSKQAITNATEDLMLGTPRYWLTPSLIALASWINNNKPLAEKALNEGLSRHQLKTVLIFTLICNRLKRRVASFMWLSKYFENQNPLEMPQETLILVNAYTDGVFGPDSEGECLVQIKGWLNYLSQQPETVKALEERWRAKIDVLPINDIEKYEYLSQYSPDFPLLKDLLEKALKNGSLKNYLENIFTAEKIEKDYVEELDDILYKLVEEYDADEYELRKKHRMCELIIKHEGDKELAEKDFDANVVQLFEHKVTFFDILTNAVTLEDSSPTMRKLAIVLMKEWILNAHQDFIAQYRNSYPQSIKIRINNWEDETKDGSNVDNLTKSYKSYLEISHRKALKETHVSYWAIALLIGFVGWMCFAYCTAALVFTIGGALYLVLDIFNVNKARKALIDKFNKAVDTANSLIHSICADFVDWQKAYANADKEAENTHKYLEQYSPTDFSNNSADNKILMFDKED